MPLIAVGTNANDGTGDPLRTAFQKLNRIANPDSVINADSGDYTGTVEQKLTSAIAAAASAGKKYCWMPWSFCAGGYLTANVTFNNAVRMIREYGNHMNYDVVAYGADPGGNASCHLGVNAAISASHAGSPQGIPGAGSTVEFPGGQFKVTSPIICLNDVNIVGNSNHGYGTELVPVNSDTFKLRGSDNGGSVFRVHVRQLNITCTQAQAFMPFEISSGYSCSVRDVFVNNCNNGMTISGMRQTYLYNVNLWGTGAVGQGIDIDNSDVYIFNPDIENFQNNIRIGASVQTDNGVAIFGGYMERFGAYGIKFVNARNCSVFGMYIIAPNTGAIPVGFQATVANGCQFNKIFGGNLLGVTPGGYAWTQNASSNNNAVLWAGQTGVGDDLGNAFYEIRDGKHRGVDLAEVSPAALGAGNNNNYNIYTATTDGNPAWVRFSANAAGSTLTGLANGRTGHKLYLVNVSAFGLTLTHQDANSTAANRFTSPSGAGVLLGPNDCACLIYDGTSATWRIVSVLT